MSNTHKVKILNTMVHLTATSLDYFFPPTHTDTRNISAKPFWYTFVPTIATGRTFQGSLNLN